MRACSRWLAALVLVALCSASAYAQDFQTHYNLALALYQAQKYEESIPEFKAAYEIDPKPGLLFNIAQAYRKAGHPRDAIQYYDRYLSVEPRLDGDTRRKVDGYLAEARNTLAALEPEMKRRLAEEKAAREQEPPPVEAPATRAEPVPPQAAVQPATPAGLVAVESQAPKPIYKRWWFWTIVGGVVAAGVVTGVVVGTQSSSPGRAMVPTGVPRATITF
jgi:tetratricopeptide (TPR) repeat protein